MENKVGGENYQVVIAVNEDLTPIGGGTELAVSTYLCFVDFDGATVGDTITATQVIDASTNPPTTISTVWRNQTTGLDLESAPSATTIELIGAHALTNAQLRADPLMIEATALPLPDGAATAANQVFEIAYLADIAEVADKYQGYRLHKTSEEGGIKYLIKSNGVGWLMIRKTTTETGSLIEYAGDWNNPGLSVETAWSIRVGLVYGLIA